MNIKNIRLAFSGALDALKEIEKFYSEENTLRNELLKTVRQIKEYETERDGVLDEIEKYEEELRVIDKKLQEKRGVANAEIETLEKQKAEALLKRDSSMQEASEKERSKKDLAKSLEDVLEMLEKAKEDLKMTENRNKEVDLEIKDKNTQKTDLDNDIKHKTAEIKSLTETRDQTKIVLLEEQELLKETRKHQAECEKAVRNFDKEMKTLEEEKQKIKAMKRAYDQEYIKKEKDITERFAELTIREDKLKENYGVIKRYNDQVGSNYKVALPNIY